ncbi:hypothetical protein G7085_11275 [Tessaracoccus sp. HDW20]|nr:hypothetical protein [Tessaracoccus coleopterorum]
MPANGRQPWFGTSCCPTNLMRTIATVHDLVATSTADGVQIHQFAAAEVSGGKASFVMRTAYPWDLTVDVEITSAPGRDWELSLRIPAWAEGPPSPSTVKPSTPRSVTTPGSAGPGKRVTRCGSRSRTRRGPCSGSIRSTRPEARSSSNADRSSTPSSRSTSRPGSTSRTCNWPTLSFRSITGTSSAACPPSCATPAAVPTAPRCPPSPSRTSCGPTAKSDRCASGCPPPDRKEEHRNDQPIRTRGASRGASAAPVRPRQVAEPERHLAV